LNSSYVYQKCILFDEVLPNIHYVQGGPKIAARSENKNNNTNKEKAQGRL
jgi:hypothetical protein